MTKYIIKVWYANDTNAAFGTWNNSEAPRSWIEGIIAIDPTKVARYEIIPFYVIS